MRDKVLNLLLRGITLFSKFLMMFYLAFYLKPQEVGLYGLFLSVVMYMIYLIGFEFYTYSNREIASQDKKHWKGYIRDQMVLVLFISFFVVPASLVIFYKNFLPWTVLGFFYPILFIEYISQEINRFLVSMSRQIKASIVLFARGGFWPLAVIAVMYFHPEYRRLEYVMYLWIIGGSGAIFLGIYFMRDVFQIPSLSGVALDWIFAGVKIAIPLLIASLATRSLFTLDRFFIGSSSSLEVLGPYVFFASIATAISAFVDSALIVFYYPKMIKSGYSHDIKGLLGMTCKLFKQIMFLGLGFSFLILPFTYFILNYLGHEIYYRYFYLLYWLLGSVVIFCLSMSPHLALYALRKDRSILLSNIFCFLFFVLTASCLGRFYSIHGVMISLFISCVLLLTIKFYFLNAVLIEIKKK